MNNNQNFLFLFIAVVVVFLNLTGCVQHQVLAPIPSMQTGSPLTDVPPSVFAIKEVTDTRGHDQFRFMDDWGAHNYKLERPIKILVTQAICKELERNGHQCVVFEQQLPAQFIISGSVLKYWLEMMTHKATVEVKVSITPFSTEDKREFTKNYKGEYVYNVNQYAYTGGYDYQGTVFGEMMEQALMRMLSEMSTDSDLIAFLLRKNM